MNSHNEKKKVFNQHDGFIRIFTRCLALEKNKLFYLFLVALNEMFRSIKDTYSKLNGLIDAYLFAYT